MKRDLVLLFVLSLLLQACAKPVRPGNVVSAPGTACEVPPPDVFTKLGIDISFAESTYGKIIVGDFNIKTQPDVVTLLSQAASDTRMRNYLRCLTIQRDKYTPEQAAYLERFNVFAGTKPTADQFIQWQRENPFNPAPQARRVTPEQRAFLVKALKPLSPQNIKVLYSTADPEQKQFAEDLIEALRAAGWVLEVTSAQDVRTDLDEKGLTFAVNSTPPYPKGSDILQRALKEAHIDSKWVPNRKRDEILMVVGKQ